VPPEDEDILQSPKRRVLKYKTGRFIISTIVLVRYLVRKNADLSQLRAEDIKKITVLKQCVPDVGFEDLRR
jgi:hypothetical protein